MYPVKVPHEDPNVWLGISSAHQRRIRYRLIFSLADVYVMSSISEPFSLSPLEALANNVPAVITKQSGVAEVLNHTLVAEQDLKALTWEKAACKIINVYEQTKGM